MPAENYASIDVGLVPAFLPATQRLYHLSMFRLVATSGTDHALGERNKWPKRLKLW